MLKVLPILGDMTPEIISEWLQHYKLNTGLAAILGHLLSGIYLFIIVLLANFVAKQLITHVIHPIIGKTSVQWDDLLIEHKVIVHFSHVVPAAMIHFFAPALFANSPEIVELFQTLVNTYLIVIILLVINCVLNFTRALWERSSVGKRYPAKSFIQAAKLVINLIGLIFILSAVLGKSPLVFFSGLGAVTAILLSVSYTHLTLPTSG